MKLNYDKQFWKKPCPKVDCKHSCDDCCGISYIAVEAALGDDITGKVLPKKGLWKNTLVEYKSNGAMYLYTKDEVPRKIK